MSYSAGLLERLRMKVRALDASHVAVWIADLNLGGETCAELEDLLSEDERARAARYVFAKDRRQFVATRGVLRCLLAAYLAADPARIRFAYSSYGKPTVAPGTAAYDVRFNVSHSSDAALLGFAVGRDVGVDVECLVPGIDVAGLAATCFSAEEQAGLDLVSESDRLESFYTYWTLKEAYVKARGGGLQLPLQEFTVVPRLDHFTFDVKWLVGGDASEWCIRKLAMDRRFAGAVAAEGRNWQAHVHVLPISAAESPRLR